MTDAFADTPDAGSAADDLRAAAEGKTPEHKPSTARVTPLDRGRYHEGGRGRSP